MQLKGVFPAMATPLTPEEKIDQASLKKLVHYLIDGGIHGIVALGSTGEFPAMSDSMRQQVMETALAEVNGRVPVLIGCGEPGTQRTIEQVRIAGQSKADGVLVAVPYYFNMDQPAVIRHYQAVAEASLLPVVLYNLPQMTKTSFTADTVAKLAKHPNIAGVKEASHDLTQIKAIIDGKEDFAVYSGNDDQNLDILKLGGQGFISVTGNLVPKQLKALSDAYFGDDLLSAARIQNSLAALNDVLFIESNPVPVKAALNHIGRNVGTCRLPLVDLEAQNHAKLIDVMKASGVCDS